MHAGGCTACMQGGGAACMQVVQVLRVILQVVDAAVVVEIRIGFFYSIYIYTGPLRLYCGVLISCIYYMCAFVIYYSLVPRVLRVLQWPRIFGN